MAFEGPHHKRLRDFHAFDRITFEVVPRYKTSGLSGDEWRTSVSVKFHFKGAVVHESSFRDMETALMMIGTEWLKAHEPIPEEVIRLEKTKCDQPGCSNDAVARFQLKRETSRDGSFLDPADTYGKKFRRFCRTHLRRGDCSREDADDNYEPLDGLTADASTNTKTSPSGRA